jgi:hypothetical protein
MVTLLSKILNYEAKIFEEYSLKRQTFLKSLSEIKTNNLSKTQLLIFINNIKDIIDPIKTSNSAIDYYLINSFYKKKEDVPNLLFYLFLITFLEKGISESSDSELTELSESSESESLESDSE